MDLTLSKTCQSNNLWSPTDCRTAFFFFSNLAYTIPKIILKNEHLSRQKSLHTRSNKVGTHIPRSTCRVESLRYTVWGREIYPCAGSKRHNRNGAFPSRVQPHCTVIVHGGNTHVHGLERQKSLLILHREIGSVCRTMVP